MRERGLRPLLLGACLLALGLLSAPAVASAQTITGPGIPTTGQPVPGSPVFISFTNQFSSDLSTTLFQVSASSADGSPLSYSWTLSAQCGGITAPGSDQPTNGYFHGPSSAAPNGCPPPPGNEIGTTVSVTVFRSADRIAGGGPKPGAPGFTFTMVARAGDDADTAGYPANAKLEYFGTAPATPSPSPSPSPEVSAPSTTQVAASSPPVGLWVLLIFVFFVVVAIAIWTYLRRGVIQTVEKPPEDKCAKEKAALAAAEAALKAARAKFDAVDAAQKNLQSAQSKQAQAQDDWDKAQRASGAEEHTSTASADGGPTITKKSWTYKHPSQQKQAESAHAALDAANAAVAAAQKAFDDLGGWDAWNEANRALQKAKDDVKAARDALDKCLGLAGTPGEGGTTTGGTTDRGGTHGGDPPGGGGDDHGPQVGVGVPPTQEKPKDPCAGKPPRKVTVCSGTVQESWVGQIKLLESGWFEPGDNARDLLHKFGQADDAFSMASDVAKAFTDPVGSIIDSAQRAGQAFGKLPPSDPGSYQDAMKGAITNGLEDLTNKLDKFHGTIKELTAAWPVITYSYTGTVTCECKNGVYVVTDRSFTVEAVPPPVVQTRELTSDPMSGMVLAEDVGPKLRTLITQLTNANNAAENKLSQEQQKVDQAGCGD